MVRLWFALQGHFESFRVDMCDGCVSLSATSKLFSKFKKIEEKKEEYTPLLQDRYTKISDNKTLGVSNKHCSSTNVHQKDFITDYIKHIGTSFL